MTTTHQTEREGKDILIINHNVPKISGGNGVEQFDSDDWVWDINYINDCLFVKKKKGRKEEMIYPFSELWKFQIIEVPKEFKYE